MLNESNFIKSSSARTYGQFTSVEELNSSATELSENGRVDEALHLYRTYLNQPKDDKQRCEILFNYGWFLQKMNLMDEAFRVQESFVKAYSSYITSQATAGLH
jgi:Tfp pilus assembly protein PilF